jgi:putative NIF3 family GTP cyclohydrolase 1 type 2
MKACEFVNHIYLAETVSQPGTVDRIITDNKDKEVKKVATCMVITPDVLRAAAEWGADLIVTHEPTFLRDKEDCLDKKQYEYKKSLLGKYDIAVCRWHDTPHDGDVDDVNAAIVKRMNWKGRFDGTFIFEFDEPISPLQIAKDIRDNMNVKHPRIVGRRDGEVKKISIQSGARGFLTYEQMAESDIDLIISGETCEWYACEPIRDMAQIGMQKTIILIGHVGSERDAMCDLAEKINNDLSDKGIEARYFDCGELYTYID